MIIALLLLIKTSFACITFSGNYLCDESINVSHKLELDEGRAYFSTNELIYEADGYDHPIPEQHGLGLGKYNVSCFEDLIVARAEFYREKDEKLLKTQTSYAEITVLFDGNYLYKKGNSVFYDESGNTFENATEMYCIKQ